MKASSKFLLALSLLAAAPAFKAAPALACGGFFCSRQPIDQAAERILFVKDGEEMVAHVQIQYTGPSEKFSWVVPVPTPPKLSVGSEQLFQTLRNTTRPQFNLQLRTEGVCKSERSLFDGVLLAPTSAARNEASAPGGAQVISRADVGPYDTVVLKGDSVAVLKDWLKANDYDVPATVDPLLEPYIKNKMYLLALKLRKNFDAGDLQPIAMRYLAAKPMIPIQLTAVAATPDMDVQLWILGAHRAIPVNYPHVEINEARLDWINGGQNYSTVVTEAMNEAGGRGFVTDYAGDSKIVPMDQIDPARFDLESLRSQKDPIAFAEAVRPWFPSNGAYTSFLTRHVSKPASLAQLDDASFYGNLSAYADALRQAEVTLNTGPAIAELDETLVKPLKDIRRLFMENPYLTRLYSTLSPNEMTADPMFDFNTQMAKVALTRTAQGVRLCSRDVTMSEAPIRITTPKGLTFMVSQRGSLGGNFAQPVNGAAGTALPAAARIQRTAASGAPETLTDNSSKIASSLSGNQAVEVRPDGTAAVRPYQQGFGCACQAPNTTRSAAQELKGVSEGLAYAAVLLGFLGWRKLKRK